MHFYTKVKLSDKSLNCSLSRIILLRTSNALTKRRDSHRNYRCWDHLERRHFEFWGSFPATLILHKQMWLAWQPTSLSKNVTTEAKSRQDSTVLAPNQEPSKSELFLFLCSIWNCKYHLTLVGRWLQHRKPLIWGTWCRSTDRLVLLSTVVLLSKYVVRVL